jgi:hypothetical protein
VLSSGLILWKPALAWECAAQQNKRQKEIAMSQVEKAIRFAELHRKGDPLFINARTDLFLGTDPATHPGKIPDALQRQAA